MEAQPACKQTIHQTEGLGPSSGDSYQFIRKAGPYEVLTHLFHNLGIQSNILVYAEYSHAGSGVLTRTKIFRALETPTIRKEKGNHRLWEARLPAVYFKDCVEFIDDLIDGDASISKIIETAHNQWLDTRNETKPWWKLLVVNGTYAFFIYHHSIGDGLSGYAFHRSLLAALNSEEVASTSQELKSEDAVLIGDHPKDPPLYPSDLITEKISWPRVIYNLLLWQIIRFFINYKHFLFSDAIFPKTYPTVAKPLPIEERTITTSQTLRFTKEEMQKFTLASDIYPKAKIGFSRVAVNIRPLLKVDPGPDIFTNAASQYARKQFLGKYRKAAYHCSPSGQNPSSKFPVNESLIWDLAKALKEDMNNAIHTTRQTIQDFIIGKLLGEDEEEVGVFYGMGMYQNNGFLISNLGTFTPKKEMQGEGWKITDVGFSASTIRAALGDIGMMFCVASIKDGECLIIATYEKEVLKDEMVEKVLEGVGVRARKLFASE